MMPKADAWRTRARLNLTAADVLLEQPDHQSATPAASRIYYALFQACVAELIEGNLTPRSLGAPGERWRHKMVERNLRATERLRCCSEAERVYKDLRELRETADYGPGFVSIEDVRPGFKSVKTVLTQFGIAT